MVRLHIASSLERHHLRHLTWDKAVLLLDRLDKGIWTIPITLVNRHTRYFLKLLLRIWVHHLKICINQCLMHHRVVLHLVRMIIIVIISYWCRLMNYRGTLRGLELCNTAKNDGQHCNTAQKFSKIPLLHFFMSHVKRNISKFVNPQNSFNSLYANHRNTAMFYPHLLQHRTKIRPTPQHCKPQYSPQLWK